MLSPARQPCLFRNRRVGTGCPADETLRQVLQRVVVSGGNRALHWRRDTDTPVVREMVSGTVLVIDQTACASVLVKRAELRDRLGEQIRDV